MIVAGFGSAARTCRRCMAFARRDSAMARGRPLLIGVAAIALLASAPAAMAGDFTWTGGAGDLLWNTPGNWEPGSTPTSDDAATIAAQTPPANKILANGADSAASLKIGGLGGKDTTSLSIAGSNTLTLSGALDILSG